MAKEALAHLNQEFALWYARELGFKKSNKQWFKKYTVTSYLSSWQQGSMKATLLMIKTALPRASKPSDHPRTSVNKPV